MTTSKYILVLCLLSLFLVPANAQIGMQELADSLTAYTGFSPVWAPPVRVKQLRVSGKNITVRTNKTLRDVRWTPTNVASLKRRVSTWVLGHPNGNVTLIAGRTNIESLITECARLTAEGGLTAKRSNSANDLTDRQVVLYPSHGLYFNRDRNEWIWQRATLWTTVEDLYSQEYVRLIKRMLENAGATVRMPRAGLDQAQYGASGMPAWTEGARAWLVSQNADSTLWDLYEGDEYKEDMKCRAMWVNALETPPDLCVAFHTDGLDSGDDTTIVGTLVIYTAHDDDNHTTLRNGKDREKINRNLADWIQTQVTQDLRYIAPEWTRRQLKEANYCETRVPVVPSIILELLSHKNMADMRYGLDPKFRFAASRAVYKGILRYLNGPAAVVQPLPVQELAISLDGVLRWKPVMDSIEASAQPTYYMVYTQADDGAWDVQQVTDTAVQLALQPGIRYNYYVVAGNEGGLSFPSPIVSAYRNDQMANDQMVLVVDAFNDTYGPEWFADSTYAGIVPGTYACEDGFSCAYIGEQWNYRRTDPWTNDDNCGWGACYRDHAGHLTVGNTHDYAAQHGRVLQQMNISYCSCTAGMLNDQMTNNWYMVNDQMVNVIDYICGRQRQPLTPDHCSLLAEYLDHGGRLLLSTDHFSAIDPVWAKRYLHASYYAAKATHSGRIKGLRPHMYFLWLQPNDEQLFTAHPEALQPLDEALKIATYEDMRVPAAVGFKSPITNHPYGASRSEESPITLVFGFPLEAVINYEKIYRHSIEWILE